MSMETAMNGVESLAFSVAVNLAAGKTGVMRLIREHALYKDLREQASVLKDKRIIVERIQGLSRKEIDLAYEHPDDIAFCAYLLVLEELGSAAEVSEAKDLVSKAPNCAWAAEIWPTIKVPPEAKAEDLSEAWNIICQELLPASEAYKGILAAADEFGKYYASLSDEIEKAFKRRQELFAPLHEMLSELSRPSDETTAWQELVRSIADITAAWDALPDAAIMLSQKASTPSPASVALTQTMNIIVHMSDLHFLQEVSEPPKIKMLPAWQSALLSGNDYRLTA